MKWLAFFLILAIVPPALAEGTLRVDNQSAYKIKVVGEGGAARLEPKSGPSAISFSGEHDVGLHLNIWWVKNPRELCRIFTPFDRLVIVSGRSTIMCRSLGE